MLIGSSTSVNVSSTNQACANLIPAVEFYQCARSSSEILTYELALEIVGEHTMCSSPLLLALDISSTLKTFDVMLETCHLGIHKNPFKCAAKCKESMSSECSEYYKCASIDTSSQHMLQRICEYHVMVYSIWSLQDFASSQCMHANSPFWTKCL